MMKCKNKQARLRGRHRKHRLSPWQRIREYIWPSMGLLPFLRYQKASIERQKDSPHKLAGGVGIGVFVGILPTFGQPLLAILLSWLFGFHLIAATISTFLGNPWTFPFIWAWCYQLGHFIMGTTDYAKLPDFNEIRYIMSNPEHLWSEYFLPILVGAVPTGIVCGLLSYAIVYWYLIWYQHRRGLHRQERARGWRRHVEKAESPPCKLKRKKDS